MIFADRSRNCGPRQNAEIRVECGLPKRIRTSDPQLRRLIKEMSIGAALRPILGPQMGKHHAPQTQCLRGVYFVCGPKICPSAAVFYGEGFMTDEQIAQIAKDLEQNNIHFTLIDFARAVLQAASAAPAQEPDAIKKALLEGARNLDERDEINGKEIGRDDMWLVSSRILTALYAA